MEDLARQQQDQLLTRLDEARSRQKTYRVVAGLWAFFALTALVLAADLFIYQGWSLPSERRLLILHASWWAEAALLFACVAIPTLLPRPSRARVAQTVERHDGCLRNGLMTVAEDRTAPVWEHVSSAIFARAVQWTAETCSGLDFRKALSRFARNCCAVTCGVSIATLVAVIARDPGSAAEAWNSFASEYTTIIVQPGDTYVQYGESVKVTIEMSGRLTLENWLLYRDSGYADDGPADYEEVKLIERVTGTREFVHVLGPVRRPIAYRVRANGKETREYRVKLKNPELLTIRHTVRYPEAFGLEPERRDGGAVETFPGVTVRLQAESSEPLQSAQLVMKDGSRAEMEVEGATAYGQFPVREPGAYHLELTDLEGDRNLNPETFEIKTITEPVLRLLAPGSREMLPHALLPLKVWTGDDRGVLSAELRYKLRSEERADSPAPEHVETLDMVPRPRPIQLLDLTWHLRNRCLGIGEVVTYRVEVKDEHGNVTCSSWHHVEVTEQVASERYEQRARPAIADIVRNQEQEKWPRRYRKMIGTYFDRLAEFSRGDTP